MKSDSKQDHTPFNKKNHISISNERYPFVTDINIALIDIKSEKFNYDEVAILYTELEKSLSEIVKLKSRYRGDLSLFNIDEIMGKSKCDNIKDPITYKSTFDQESLSNPSSSGFTNENSGSQIILKPRKANIKDVLGASFNNEFKSPLNKKLKTKIAEGIRCDRNLNKLDIQQLNLEYNIDVPNEFWNSIDEFFVNISSNDFREINQLLLSPLKNNKKEGQKLCKSHDISNDLLSIPILGKRRYLQKCNKHKRKFKVTCPKCEIVFLNKFEPYPDNNFKDNNMIKKQESLIDLDNDSFAADSPFELLTQQMVNSLLQENTGILDEIDTLDMGHLIPADRPTFSSAFPQSSSASASTSHDALNAIEQAFSQQPSFKTLLSRGKNTSADDKDEVLEEIESCQSGLKFVIDRMSKDCSLDLPPSHIKAYMASQGPKGDLSALDEEIKEMYKRYRKAKLKKKEVSKHDLEKLERKLKEREELCASIAKYEE